MKNVFSSILSYARGYRKLNVVAVVDGQVLVSDSKGRLGFLSGVLTPEELEQKVVLGKSVGTREVKVVTQASYHCYDTAELVCLCGENNQYLAKLRKHDELVLVNANRQYHIGECLAVNQDKKLDVANYVK